MVIEIVNARVIYIDSIVHFYMWGCSSHIYSGKCMGQAIRSHFWGTKNVTNILADKGLSIYYVILFWPFSDPYPIKLAASYLLETPLPLKLITKCTPYPHHVIPCYLFPDPPPIITDNVIYGQPLNQYVILGIVNLLKLIWLPRLTLNNNSPV